jgi:cytochrome c
MDSWEWNKIAGAVLGTLLFVMVIRIGTEVLFEHEPMEKPGYVVEGVSEEAAPGAAAPVAEAIPDFGTVLPTADVAAGQAIAQRCTQCHDISSAKANKIGPEIWGVVNRPRATVAGYSYSSAMKSNNDPWTYEHLFRFLKTPAVVVPGTKMSFAGLRSAQDRINLLAFLRTNADSPAPIPAPAPAAPAPAEGAAAPAAEGAAPAAGAPAEGAKAPAEAAPKAPATPPTKTP